MVERLLGRPPAFICGKCRHFLSQKAKVKQAEDAEQSQAIHVMPEPKREYFGGFPI